MNEEMTTASAFVSRTVEQKTLDCLERIENLLERLVELKTTQEITGKQFVQRKGR